jgi:hypothetical protein
VDPGPRVFAFAGEDWAVRVDLGQEPNQRKIRRLQRKVDRGRRKGNPANYLPDGSIKPGQKRWTSSQRQKYAERLLAEMQRKAGATRKTTHGALANELLRRGSVIKIEKNSYKSFQRSFFGKSVGHAAPAAFVSTLKRKAESAGAAIHELPAALRLSQTCHGCTTPRKKMLSLRVHECQSCKIGPVQRDLYSAWLARHVVATNGPSGLRWQLDAAQAQAAWAATESWRLAASSEATVLAFCAGRGTQPAKGNSRGVTRLLPQGGGLESVANTTVSPGRKAPDAVPVGQPALGEPAKAPRVAVRTPGLESQG